MVRVAVLTGLVSIATIQPLFPAESADEVLNQAVVLLRAAKIDVDANTHFLRDEQFVHLVVDQAKLPPECTGATLQVRMTAGETKRAYHSFIRVGSGPRPVLLATAVVHEQHHLKCRRSKLPYTAAEEARAMREEVRLLQIALPEYETIEKRIQMSALRTELGGGWIGVVETSAVLRQQLLNILGVPVIDSSFMQAHNLILAICNDEQRLAHILANSNYRTLIAGK